MDRGTPGSEPPPQAETLLAGLKGWCRDGLELIRVRVELLGLEAGEHARQVAELIAWAVVAAFMFCLSLVFVALLITVLLWDGHRTLVLGLFSGIFVALGGVAVVMVRLRIQQTRRWFEATTQELARDVQQLKS